MTEPTIDPNKLFAPIERAILEAFALRSGAKALASLRPLMWLAYLALAQAFGLAHIITPEMRAIAIDAARRPGRRKVESDGQGSLLDLFPTNDGRPGIYVSFARLKLGNVRDVQGDSVLDLTGITELPDALVKAYEQGWIGGPSGNGLRFIPPTVWGLVVDHNSAGFARNGGVDEHIAALESSRADAIEREGVVRDELARERMKLEHRIAELQAELDKALASIAESARLPIVEPTKEPCPHKGVMLFDGKRTCTSCNEPLPDLPNGKVTKMRKNAHKTLTTNEEPRDPLPSSTMVKASKSSRAKESLNRKTSKKAAKGRAS